MRPALPPREINAGRDKFLAKNLRERHDGRYELARKAQDYKLDDPVEILAILSDRHWRAISRTEKYAGVEGEGRVITGMLRARPVTFRYGCAQPTVPGSRGTVPAASGWSGAELSRPGAAWEWSRRGW